MEDPIINAATIMPVVKRLEESSKVLTNLVHYQEIDVGEASEPEGCSSLDSPTR